MKMKLTVNESNLILNSIARHPYNVVAQLIGLMSQQAQSQLGEDTAEIEFEFELKTINTIIEFLIKEEYGKVATIIDKINKQVVDDFSNLENSD